MRKIALMRLTIIDWPEDKPMGEYEEMVKDAELDWLSPIQWFEKPTIDDLKKKMQEMVGNLIEKNRGKFE